ncbi:MAG: hypothetical protein ACRD26_21370 [Vicinamibacterales bacterium]
MSAHYPVTTKVTWAREISSIVQRRCVSCHQPGGYAGFPLTTYAEARPWAVAIKEEVLAGEMPPWGAAPGIGHFANDRRPTRHEQEVIAAWVDGGTPYSLEARVPGVQGPQPEALTPQSPEGGVAIPLAPVEIGDAPQRTASVTLQLPTEMVLTAWTFEPGTPAGIERVDLQLGSRWLGTWTPGESSITFPPDTGAPLPSSALFSARIAYRTSPDRPGTGVTLADLFNRPVNDQVIDYSRLRVWMTKDRRPKAIRDVTIVRSWRAAGDVNLVALRPAGDTAAVQVLARFMNGRTEPIGVMDAPSHGPHPTYRLARPLPLPAGARVETTGPVRLLYSAGATRTVKPNVSRRSRR